MPVYVTLFKFTDQGIKTVKESTARTKANKKALEAAGAKILDLYYTMGEYDLVAVTEAPSDEVCMAVTLAIGMAGSVRTTTLKAFTVEQFEEIVKKLP